MNLPDYRTPKDIPVVKCCVCSASSKDRPIHSPRYMSMVPDVKAAPIAGKEFCLPCWEATYEAEPREVTCTVTIDENGRSTEKPNRITTFDGKEVKTPTGFIIEGHPWPPRPGGMLPPRVSLDRLMNNIESLAEDFRVRAGMEYRWMLNADDQNVRSLLIFEALPPESKCSVKELLSGIIPKRGLVLAGKSDVGKTGAIAAWTRSWAINHIRRNGPTAGLGQTSSRKDLYQNKVFAWLDWRLTYANWRNLEDDQHRMKDLRCVWEPLSQMPLVIIDDLGAETPNPHFGVPVVEDALTSLLDKRSNLGLPTIATTNLDEDALRSYLGERTANRLLGGNAYVALPGSWPKLSRFRE